MKREESDFLVRVFNDNRGLLHKLVVHELSYRAQDIMHVSAPYYIKDITAAHDYEPGKQVFVVNTADAKKESGAGNFFIVGNSTTLIIRPFEPTQLSDIPKTNLDVAIALSLDDALKELDDFCQRQKQSADFEIADQRRVDALLRMRTNYAILTGKEPDIISGKGFLKGLPLETAKELVLRNAMTETDILQHIRDSYGKPPVPLYKECEFRARSINPPVPETI